MSESRDHSTELEVSFVSDVAMKQATTEWLREKVPGGYEPVPSEDSRLARVGELVSFRDEVYGQTTELSKGLKALDVYSAPIDTLYGEIAGDYESRVKAAIRVDEERLERRRQEKRKFDNFRDKLDRVVVGALSNVKHNLNQCNTIEKGLESYGQELPQLLTVSRHVLGALDALSSEHASTAEERGELKRQKDVAFRRLQAQQALMDSPKAADSPERQRAIQMDQNRHNYLKAKQHTGLSRSEQEEWHARNQGHAEGLALYSPVYSPEELAVLGALQADYDDANAAFEAMGAVELDLSSRLVEVGEIGKRISAEIEMIQGWLSDSKTQLEERLGPQHQQNLLDIEKTLQRFDLFTKTIEKSHVVRESVTFDEYDEKAAALQRREQEVEGLRGTLGRAAVLADETDRLLADKSDLEAEVAAQGATIRNQEETVIERSMALVLAGRRLTDVSNELTRTRAYAWSLEDDKAGLENDIVQLKADKRELREHEEQMLAANAEQATKLGEKSDEVEGLQHEVTGRDADIRELKSRLRRSQDEEQRIAAENLRITTERNTFEQERDALQIQLGIVTRERNEHKEARIALAKVAGVTQERDRQMQVLRDQGIISDEQQPAKSEPVRDVRLEEQPVAEVHHLNLDDGRPLSQRVRTRSVIGSLAYTSPERSHEEGNDTSN